MLMRMKLKCWFSNFFSIVTQPRYTYFLQKYIYVVHTTQNVLSCNDNIAIDIVYTHTHTLLKRFSRFGNADYVWPSEDLCENFRNGQNPDEWRVYCVRLYKYSSGFVPRCAFLEVKIDTSGADDRRSGDSRACFGTHSYSCAKWQFEIRTQTKRDIRPLDPRSIQLEKKSITFPRGRCLIIIKLRGHGQRVIDSTF